MEGHDISAKEINLFVLTPDPRHVLRRAKNVLERLELLRGVSAAYLVGGARFTLLWPLRATHKFTLPYVPRPKWWLDGFAGSQPEAVDHLRGVVAVLGALEPQVVGEIRHGEVFRRIHRPHALDPA